MQVTRNWRPQLFCGYVYMCSYIYIYIYIHVHMYMLSTHSASGGDPMEGNRNWRPQLFCGYVYMYSHIYTYIYIFIYICIFSQCRALVFVMYGLVPMHFFGHIQRCVYVYIYIYIWLHIHVYSVSVGTVSYLCLVFSSCIFLVTFNDVFATSLASYAYPTRRRLP